MTYDPMNRLTRVSNTKGDSTLSVYSYQYDNNGNITSATEQIKEGTPQTSTYTNDKLNRLTGVKRADGTETAYSYDLRGNRLTQKDACDLPDEKATNYRYDLDDHLIRVGNDGASTTIQYLPDGLRYQKSQGSTTTRYGYDHWNRVTSDQQEGGTTSQYIRGDRVLVKKDLTNQKDYYYLYNGHGDVVQMVGTDGSLVNSYQYDEWGNVIQQKETISNEFKYAGELYDAETGLYYLKARYYDPKMGRFLNEDSYEGQIDNPLSMNVYTYVHNNPLIYVDPTGHLITESYKDGELRYLLIDARNHISSKSDEDYQLYKDKVIEIYNQFVGSNRYNYLFDLATGTSSYGNSAGKSDWAIAQLISAYQDYELDEYIATLAMGSVGGKGYSRGKGKGSSQRSINACQCFTAGTKVKTDQGEKDIEDIQVGDQVLSKDEKTGEVEYKVVTATFNHETDDIYKISVGDQVIESTFNHPFYVRGKGWTFVKDLKVGDLLVQSDGNTLKIDSIELLHKKVTVYNMTVDEFHTYFVSDLGIWVHNTGPCGYTSIKGKGFNKSYDNLSKNVQGKADAAFKQFKENPDHPSLNFEYLNGAPNGIKYVSARVDGSYRAYGIIRENGVIERVGINNHDYKAVIRELNSAY